VFMVSSLID